MKKVSSIVLMMLVLSSSLGMSQGVHYCDGRIVSHFLIPHMPKGCSDMQDHNSCEDVVLINWTADPFEQPSINLDIVPSIDYLPRVVVYYFNNYQAKVYPIKDQFRQRYVTDLFVMNMSFLI